MFRINLPGSDPIESADGRIDALARDVTGLRAQLSGIQTTDHWFKLLSDPKGSARRAEELTALMARAIEEKAAVEQERAALAQRSAELDASAKELRAREVELHQDKLQFEALRKEEAERAAARPQYEEWLRNHMLRLLGRAQNPLQDRPSLEMLWQELAYGRRGDMHDETAPERETSDLVTEPLESAVGGATVAHSRPRRGAERRVQPDAA
jgi:hypothetical protein